MSDPCVMAGYWDGSDATRAAIDEYGWLHTGDAARIDDEEFVWIVDRADDAHEVLGHIVYPGDVERVLAQHPAVADAVSFILQSAASCAFWLLASTRNV